MSAPTGEYSTRPLTAESWPDFAALVEANNGVWGGCWCIGFHPDGFQGSPEGNRDAKRAHVENGTVHQVLVYADGAAVGWVQYGPISQVSNIKNPKAYVKELVDLPDWRIGCVFTDRRRRGQGIARAALTEVLRAIGAAGGGLVEAYPEQVDGRGPQRGAFLHTGPEPLFADFGFTRDRKIATWRWVMRLRVPPGVRDQGARAVGAPSTVPGGCNAASDGSGGSGRCVC